MIKTLSGKQSLYMTISIVVISTVIIIMSMSAAYDYLLTKNRAIEEMKQSSRLSIVSLQQNIVGMIEAYAVNEYDKLVLTEIENRDHFAIVVEDYNMGKILGSATFISGKTRDDAGRIIDYDPDNADHRRKLSECYYSQSNDILAASGEKIGSVSIYISDTALNRELHHIITENLKQTLFVSLLLILSLFIALRSIVLDPLSKIVDVIKKTDDDGIPLKAIPEAGAKEISVLSKTMNSMIGTIKRARMAFQEQHALLQYERNRFELAVDGTLDGMWDWNLQTGEVIHSARFETMLGYEKGELPDTIACWADLLHPEDAEQAHQRVKEYLEGRGTGVYENTFRMRTKSGEWRWITGRGKALFDQDGKALRFVGFNTDITKQVEQQEQLLAQKNILQYQASHDALTGLPNRLLFHDRLERGIEKARRNATRMGVLFIDLDHFKEINDSLGHKTGDKVLKIVTERLMNVKRKEDTLARLGGDEFTVIIEGLKEVQDASVLAKKILHTLGEPIILEEHELYVGSSIGISLFPDNGDNSADLLKNADAAMYKAKNEGRHNFQYYSSEMTEQAYERVRMETKLRTALKKEEFVVYYQPQVDARSDKVVGMEALVRWESPEMGLIPPSKFIPIAESTGLIIDLDRLVMRAAMTQMAKWHQQGYSTGTLAMNLAIRQIQQKDFIPFFKALIVETGCRADCLELEVMESQIMKHPEQSIDTLNEISETGVKLALDDFGTGYSSLSYLKRLPINKLKIDRMFVKDLPDDEEDAAISKAVIALAESLNLQIIAEGAETVAQKQFLVENGCHYIQGYFYARPMPAAEMEIILREGF